MINGFENERATFLVERQVGTTNDDPYSDEETPEYDWVPLSLDDDEWDYVDGEVVYDEGDLEPASVRAEQRSAGYVREVYGEWPQEVYRLYVAPRDIGDVVDETETDADGNEIVIGRSYELGVAADDRVELAGVTGTFSLQPSKLQRLDSEIPEYVELEITRVEV